MQPLDFNVVDDGKTIKPNLLGGETAHVTRAQIESCMTLNQESGNPRYRGVTIHVDGRKEWREFAHGPPSAGATEGEQPTV